MPTPWVRRQVLLLADEKVSLAGKIYDYVDQRIRRLDRDLAVFDEELARERAKLGVVVRPVRLSR
jgi:hypothetical protein